MSAHKILIPPESVCITPHQNLFFSLASLLGIINIFVIVHLMIVQYAQLRSPN